MLRQFIFEVLSSLEDPNERHAFKALKQLKVPPDVLRMEFPKGASQDEWESFLVYLDHSLEQGKLSDDPDLVAMLSPKFKGYLEDLKHQSQEMPIDDEFDGVVDMDAPKGPVSSPLLLWIGVTVRTAHNSGELDQPELYTPFDYAADGYDQDIVRDLYDHVGKSGWKLHGGAMSADALMYDPKHWKEMTRAELFKKSPSQRIYGVEATGLGADDTWLYPISREARWLTRLAIETQFIHPQYPEIDRLQDPSQPYHFEQNPFVPLDEPVWPNLMGLPPNRHDVGYYPGFYTSVKDYIKEFGKGGYHLTASNIFDTYQMHSSADPQLIGMRVLGLA